MDDCDGKALVTIPLFGWWFIATMAGTRTACVISCKCADERAAMEISMDKPAARRIVRT
jgi:hypothetical protein